jgi:hypothetical protein
VPEWLRTHGVTLAAATLIVIQLLWMGDLLAHSYFREDDYSHLYRGLQSGFGWGYLISEPAGQLMPLGMAFFWVLARASLYNWPLASVIILVLLAATSLAMLRMLRTLFGNRPAILVLFALFMFSPLQLAGSWWSWALIILPVELALCMAIDAHVRYLRGGRMRNAVAAAGWLLVGMAASDKGVVVPLVLFGLTSAFFVAGPWAAAAVKAAVRYWRVWLLYGIVLAAWGAVYLSQLSSTLIRPSIPGSASNVLGFVSTFTGTVLLPSALGGPWRWSAAGYSLAYPPMALQQLSWAVFVIVVVVSCCRRVRAWRAWAILAGWIVAADIVPVVFGRLGQWPGSLLGMQTRYLEDAAPVLALCTGLAFLPLVQEQGAIRFRLPAAGPATALVVGVCLIGSFWSLQSFESQNSAAAAAARSYVATTRAAVADAPPGTLIIDGPTPASVMSAEIFGQYGYTSRVIGGIARGEPAKHLSWTSSPSGVLGNLMIFNNLGQLLPVTVQGPASPPPPPGKSCWNVTSAGTGIPLKGSLFRWSWIVRLDYSGPSTVLALRLGEKWADVTLPVGAHAFYVPLVGKGNEVTVRLIGSGPTLIGTQPVLAGTAPSGCVTSVTVGLWRPARSGRAIPAVPVPS